MQARLFRRRDSMSALRFPAYRWFMAGRFAAAMTIEMRAVAVGWIVYHMTGSASALGWQTVASSLAVFVLAPVGGALADRVEKRTILIWTRFVLVVTAFIVAWLFYVDLLQAWHLTLFSMSNGMVFAFMMPAQETIPSDLVDRESLLNAISLGLVIESSFGIVGATLAGWMLAGIGAGGVFVALGLLFLSVCMTLFKLPKVGTRHADPGEPMLTTLVEGVRHVSHEPALLAVLGLSLATNCFLNSYRTFLAAYAKDILSMDATGLGMLTSVIGLGMLTSSLITANAGNTPHKGKMLLGAGLLGAVAMAVMVLVKSVVVGYVAMFALGASAQMVRTMIVTTMQSNCAPEFRARMISLSRMTGSVSALWIIAAGAIADRMGLQPLLLLQAVLLALIFGSVALFVPQTRRLR